MIISPVLYVTGKLLLITVGVLFLFGNRNTEKKIEPIVWSVPIPPTLLSRLREFSPVEISRTSGIYLDDVFDILKGTRQRTAPEVIDKLNETIKILKKHDEELDREAVKIGFIIRGLDVIEQREIGKQEKPKQLSDKSKKESL